MIHLHFQLSPIKVSMCSNVHVIEKPGVQPHPKTHSVRCRKTACKENLLYSGAHANHISEFMTAVEYLLGESIRLVTYAQSPATYNRLHHNQGTEEGPKRDWPSELIPAWVWKLHGKCSMDRMRKHTVKDIRYVYENVINICICISIIHVIYVNMCVWLCV